jgi:HSP20 family protein
MNDPRVNAIFDLDSVESTFRGLLHRLPQIRLDVSESEASYLVKAEMPGVHKEDIDIRLDGNQVTISAEVKPENDGQSGTRVLRSERHYGTACRKFAFAENVDDSRAAAKFTDGVLNLTLPKGATVSQRRLAIA